MNTFQRRAFSALYKYSSPSNSRVFLTVASGETKIGDLVFELYDDKQAAAAENFKAMVNGSAANGSSYIGSSFNKGMAGFGIQGGATGEEGYGAFGCFNVDGDLTLRHHKRGMLTTVSKGQHQNGSEFTVTFGAANWLDGYQTVFGELVEGDSVLSQIEAATDRHGKVNGEFTIVAGGMK
jgi:cyclophilin family peptidyl-prolyl cis-trans isomerase